MLNASNFYGLSLREKEAYIELGFEFLSDFRSNDYHMLALDGAKNLNQSTKSYILAIENLIGSVEDNTQFSLIEYRANEIQEELILDSSLPCNEKNAVYVMLEILKGSAKMYISKKAGGLGLMPEIETNLTDPNIIHTREHSGWSPIQTAMLADVGAIGVYFTGLGVFTALGAVPGANGIILGGAVFSGAASSALAVGTRSEPCP